MRLEVELSRYELKRPFRTSRGTMTHVEGVTVSVERDGVRGVGEAAGLSYRGETGESMRRQMLSVAPRLEAIRDAEDVQRLLPAGGARNAVDAALWDYQAKRAGRRVWDMVGLPEPRDIPLTATLSLDAPEVMAEAARAAPSHTALKIKLGDPVADLERVRAVRAAAPGSRLVVDANGGWTFDELVRFAPTLLDLGVEMIEQPLAAGADLKLASWRSPVALCADESCQTAGDVAAMAEAGYAVINIKLDKAGGLTQALAMVTSVRAAGLRHMVGCMVESSLALAPATLLTSEALFCDLDGPTYLLQDRQPALTINQGRLQAPAPRLWG